MTKVKAVAGFEDMKTFISTLNKALLTLEYHEIVDIQYQTYSETRHREGKVRIFNAYITYKVEGEK